MMNSYENRGWSQCKSLLVRSHYIVHKQGCVLAVGMAFNTSYHPRSVRTKVYTITDFVGEVLLVSSANAIITLEPGPLRPEQQAVVRCTIHCTFKHKLEEAAFFSKKEEKKILPGKKVSNIREDTSSSLIF